MLTRGTDRAEARARRQRAPRSQAPRRPARMPRYAQPLPFRPEAMMRRFDQLLTSSVTGPRAGSREAIRGRAGLYRPLNCRQVAQLSKAAGLSHNCGESAVWNHWGEDVHTGLSDWFCPDYWI